jgi:hypothetical protein
MAIARAMQARHALLPFWRDAVPHERDHGTVKRGPVVFGLLVLLTNDPLASAVEQLERIHPPPHDDDPDLARGRRSAAWVPLPMSVLEDGPPAGSTLRVNALHLGQNSL